jgi:DtxR family Mn-dependent transcriptional regulator
MINDASKNARMEIVEEYLETLCRLEEKGKNLTAADAARELEVSVSVSLRMLSKLSKEGYIAYGPAGSVKLTKKGKALGRKILDRHRLIERFLDAIGFSRNKIHGEACKLEHNVSDELESLMKKKLERRRRRGVLTLADLMVKEEGRIISVEGGKMLVKRLHDMGLTPGTTVRIKESAPFSGPVELCVRDSCRVIGRDVAKRIFVSVR